MRSSKGRRVLVCMDSFKGSVSAVDACAAVRRSIMQTHPGASVTCLPMADGGEGTAEALMAALDGEWVSKVVTGPLPGRRVEAGFVWVSSTRTAVVELASASGLPLLAKSEYAPLLTTSYGTGELLQAAIEQGAERLFLALGGSATNDAGLGCAQALGWRFLDGSGKDLALGGGALGALAKVISPDVKRLPRMDVLCDVTNPFTGEEGASVVFGPQKGATAEMVLQLDAGLGHVATVFFEQLGVDIERLPGGGAAGGMAGAAVALFGARLVSGVDAMMDFLQVDQQLDEADWLITGEGSFDEQSLQGKVISGLCRRAGERGVKVAVVAGRVAVEPVVYESKGIVRAVASKPDDMSLEEAMGQGADLIERAARRLVL